MLYGIGKGVMSACSRQNAISTAVNYNSDHFTGSADDGNSIVPVSYMGVTTLPPLFRNGWFFAAVSLFIVSLIYSFIRGREKSIRAIAAEKLKVERLETEKLKNQLELEQIINYFTSSLIDKLTVDEVLWDVSKNLIGRLGFVDCMIYLWNKDKTRMVQKAGLGPKGSIEEIQKQVFDVTIGQGVVGYVMQTGEAVMIADTSIDARYRADEMVRLSELAVPIIHNNELIGIIDSEHHEKNFFTSKHLQLLNTIAMLMANKIKSIEADESLRKTEVAMYSVNEQLSHARLEALQSQMNPHFIFNCINSIDALIHSNDKYGATVYLNKFAKLLRNILDGSRQDKVLFSKDLDTLKLYVELEELRNESKFKATINVPDELYNSDYKVPPLIVQPFVENAILHGLKNKPGNEGLLTITVKNHDGSLNYLIADNGIGRDAAGLLGQNKETHYGVQISCDRIKVFNKEEKASVCITDLFSNSKPAGTEVYVQLKMG
jgi:putative methionine-R-sulfoxide reductase with GAF domain